MLYEGEFAADQKGAQKRFDALKQALAASDERRLSKLLAEAPLSEWFSLIFLDGDRVKDELVPLLEKSGAPCRAAMSAALDRALEQLVDFKGLLETLKTYC